MLQRPSGFLVAMADMQWEMEQPNAMDIKLGRRSYGPLAPAEKMAMEQAKYLWRRQLGFFITGIRVRSSLLSSP